MWSEPSSPAFLAVIAASIAAHVLAIAVLPSADGTPAPPRAPTLITISTPPPAPPAPPPPPPVVEPAPTETVAARTSVPRSPRPVARRRVAPPPQVAAAAPPPASDAPVEFTGVTLSNDGASWSSPTGNGEPMTGPIATPAPAPVSPSRERGPGGGTGDRVVAVGDLSRPPKAPDLDDALAANYPAEARRAGTTGQAVVRARILADGSVGTIRVVSESGPGFGAACRRTLAGSHWQSPLDARSQPVMTDIRYTCTFAVAR